MVKKNVTVSTTWNISSVFFSAIWQCKLWDNRQRLWVIYIKEQSCFMGTFDLTAVKDVFKCSQVSQLRGSPIDVNLCLLKMFLNRQKRILQDCRKRPWDLNEAITCAGKWHSRLWHGHLMDQRTQVQASVLRKCPWPRQSPTSPGCSSVDDPLPSLKTKIDTSSNFPPNR